MEMEENPDNELEDLAEYYISYIRDDLPSWDELISAYEEPLSSILPAVRQIETEEIFTDAELEGICLDLKRAPLAGNLSSLSVKHIREWLSQFESMLDKNLAYILLSKIQLIPQSELSAIVRNLRDKTANHLIDCEHFISLFQRQSKIDNKDKIRMERWLKNNIIRYSWLPQTKSGTESQQILWSFYEREALTGSEEGCSASSKPKLLREYFEDAAVNPQTTAFVFMDYTLGSGDQLQGCLREINKLFEEYADKANWREAYYVFMFVAKSKKFQKSSLTFSASNWTIISAEDMLDYEDEVIINQLQNYSVSISEYDDFVKKYSIKSSGTSDLGYLNTGGILCHHYSCPNNTLYFFHKSFKNWRPIFKNSQTPPAVPYNRRTKKD